MKVIRAAAEWEGTLSFLEGHEKGLLPPHSSPSELLATAMSTHMAQSLHRARHVVVVWFASVSPTAREL